MLRYKRGGGSMAMSVRAQFTGRLNKGHPIKICGKEVTQEVTARFL